MLTDKQLLFALGQVQEVQKKHFGEGIGITIITGRDTTDFVVNVDYGVEKMPQGDLIPLEKEFEFNSSLTEDQCVDYLQDIEKIVKKC